MSLACITLVVTPAQFRARKAFYEATLAILSFKEWKSNKTFIGLANSSGIPQFFLIAKEESVREPTRNVHFGFRAEDRETVHKFHAAALAAGGKNNGDPGPRDYTPTYYGGYIHDDAGNNVECFHLEE